mmetsp:Transcript_668/g.1779  ORF Transcript_668/g.1779 Transcript_668/m.1779 type:complete len:286 (+) Transcript_668:67-924(+)
MRLFLAICAALVSAVALVVLLGGGRNADDRTRYGLLTALICAGIIGLQYLAARLPEQSALSQKLNLKRKAQHIATGLALAQIFLLFSEQVCILALGAGTLALVLLQVARAASEAVNLEFLRFFGSMLKPEERIGTRPPAAVYFLVGLFLCLVMFPRRLTLLCTLVASLADPSAAIGGVALGGPAWQLRLARKSLAGCFCCFLVAAILAVIVVLTTPGFLPPALDLVAAGVLCGFAASACEMAGGVSLYLDDNLLTSFGTGVLLQGFALAAKFAGWECRALWALLT